MAVLRSSYSFSLLALVQSNRNCILESDRYCFLLQFIFGSYSEQSAWLVLSLLLYSFLSSPNKQPRRTGTIDLSGPSIQRHAGKKNMASCNFIAAFVVTVNTTIAAYKISVRYWFNHGSLHSSRHQSGNSQRNLSASQWLKFYILVIALLLLASIKTSNLRQNKQ